MLKLDEYITDERIIFYLCRIRAKHAKQRSKKHLVHLLSSSENYNYHLNTEKQKEKIDDDLKLLNDILPSRRKWKKLNKSKRYSKNNQRINSVDYNVNSLLLTIDYYRKNNPEEPFLKNLDNFIMDLRESINNPDYNIESPTIIPKLKGDKHPKKNKCRPISLFKLKDRLIISFINKYLTEVFDSYFYPKSFAFRAVQINGDDKKVLTHHDSIQAILDYKKQHKGKRLWVSECDISKFYDSVHHSIVKKQFKRLIGKVKKDKPDEYDIRAVRIFYKYLDSYSFVKNVLPYNDCDRTDYWQEKHKIPGGYFGWVEDNLIKLGFFRKVKNAKIGVPQGGAISGLIANLVLDYTDTQILNIKIPNLLYVRFCDDMVIIHPSQKECKKASQVYSDALKELHLIPHEFESNLRNTPDSFWSADIKSKHPYKWSYNSPNSFPWFGFVGYEIHYSGALRVRKSSLLKEKKKQKEVVNQIINAVKEGKRKNDGTICESAANRLIGMSVGRVTLKNFKNIENDMCWVNGFKKLSDNQHLRAQLKDLDRCRNKQMSKLINAVKDIEKKEDKITKMRIGKLAFCSISGISGKASELIRNQLVLSGILSSKFEVNYKVDFENSELNLGLTDEFLKYKDEIISIILNPLDKRELCYYGKPFSYYYHVIEKTCGQ
jgi:hypothetical protein